MAEAAEQLPEPTPDPRAEAVAILTKAANDDSAPEAAGESAESDAPPQKADPAAASEVDPKTERVSARIAAARRAEIRAAQERDRIKAERAEIERMRAEVSELAKVAEQAKLAKTSPSKLLELAGLDPKSFLEALATETEPASVAKRVASESLSEVEKLKAELAAERDAMRREREALTAAQRERHLREAQATTTQQFVNHVAESAEKYPHLVAEFTPEEIAERGWSVAMQHAEAYKARFGDYPDDEVIAEFLEQQAKERAEKRNAWRERIGQRATPPSKGKPGDAGAGQSVKANVPRTLTNGAASQKSTAPKDWSEKDAIEEAKRIIRNLHANKSDD